MVFSNIACTVSSLDTSFCRFRVFLFLFFFWMVIKSFKRREKPEKRLNRWLMSLLTCLTLFLFQRDICLFCLKENMETCCVNWSIIMLKLISYIVLHVLSEKLLFSADSFSLRLFSA